jgi:biopolymer transport protein ExbD
VDDGAAVKGYGQDANEKAFVAIGVDGEKIWSRRFDVIAVSTDGREVTSITRPFGDTAKAAGGAVKFEFDLPLAKVVKFRIGSRPIRTRQWTDVVMTESKLSLYGDIRTDRNKSYVASRGEPTVLVAIDADGRLYYQNQWIDEKALFGRLQEAASKSSDPLTLVVQADKRVTHERVMSLTRLANDAGIKRALVATLLGL